MASTYYVDADIGSDGNSGLSPALPWRYAPGMKAYAGHTELAAGDVVLFRSTSTWLVSGQQGLYLTGGVQYVGDGWGSGSRATLRAATNLDSALVRFRDHPTVATVFRGFDVDAAGKVANGIEFNHSYFVGPLTGATKRVENVVVHDVASRTSRGEYKYGIIVSNHGGAGGAVAHVEILNSIVHDISRDGLPLYPGDENIDCTIRDILVRGNVVFNTGQDPDYGAGAGIVVKGRVIGAIIEYNYVHDTKGAGIFVNGNESRHFGVGPEDVHIRANIVSVSTAHGSIRIYDGPKGGDPKEVSIYDNVIYGNSRGAGLIVGRDLSGINVLRIFNNTFFDNPVVLDNRRATFPVFEFKNNVVYYKHGPALLVNTTLTAHEGNVYFGTGRPVRTRDVDVTMHSMRVYEPSALAADPLFSDPSAPPTGFFSGDDGRLRPNPAGLSLMPASPARGHGVQLAEAFNMSINAEQRPDATPWDAGAYQSADNRAASESHRP